MSNAERCVNLLILSCDKYQDLWAPLLAGFRRFWVDPNRRTYLVSNEKVTELFDVTNIAVGPDHSWSDTLYAALDRLNERYILIWLDDVILTGVVDKKLLQQAYNFVVSNELTCLRLHPLGFEDWSNQEPFRVINSGEPYRVTIHGCIWDVATLKSLLRSGENAWHFEAAFGKPIPWLGLQP